MTSSLPLGMSQVSCKQAGMRSLLPRRTQEPCKREPAVLPSPEGPPGKAGLKDRSRDSLSFLFFPSRAFPFWSYVVPASLFSGLRLGELGRALNSKQEQRLNRRPRVTDTQPEDAIYFTGGNAAGCISRLVEGFPMNKIWLLSDCSSCVTRSKGFCLDAFSLLPATSLRCSPHTPCLPTFTVL